MNSRVLWISLLSLPLYAGTMGDQSKSHALPWVATFSIGPTWANPGRQQTLQLTPDVVKTYTANNATKTLADGEMFLGIQKDLPYDLLTHIGIAGALTSPVRVSGNIWDDGDSTFNNYTYSYQAQHGHVALKAKVFKQSAYAVLPWVSGSVGVGFNRAYSFTNTPIISEAVVQNNFGNHTQTSFTYTVGAGIQKIIHSTWQVGMGYEFADWGQSHLGSAQGQTLGRGLSLQHLYTNGLMFNLTYTA